MKIVRLSIGALERLLQEFEQRYGMSSAEFCTKFNRGELPEEDDLFRWAGYYDMASKAGLLDPGVKV